MTDELDRVAILARRRALIAVAMAAVACSLPDRPLEERVRRLPPLPDWRAIDRSIPPLGVDPRLSAREQKALLVFAKSTELVYERMRDAQKALDAVWRSPADTELQEQLGRAHRLFDREVRQMSPLCPQPEHTWILLRRDVHQRFARRQVDLLEAHIQLVAPEEDTLGAQHRPCLTCVADGAQPVREIVTFDTAQAAYASHWDATLSGLDKGAETIVVNGHAGLEESNREALSQARADNVRARLIALGYPAGRIRARGCAEAVQLDMAWLPINRRVDFDLKESETP